MSGTADRPEATRAAHAGAAGAAHRARHGGRAARRLPADRGARRGRPGRPPARPVLHAQRRPSDGAGGGRAALPAACVLLRARAREGELELPARGGRPRHRAPRRAAPGRGAGAGGPARDRLAPAPRTARGRCSWAAGSAPAPLLCWQDELGPTRRPARLPLRRPRRGGRAVRARARAWRPTTARPGGQALVTDLLREELDGPATVFACGPPRDARGGPADLRRARACRPSWRSNPAWPAASARASAAWCRPNEGYVRLCVDGPVLDGMLRPGAGRLTDLCGVPLAGPS